MEFIQELRRTGRLDDDKGTARVLTPEEREHLDEVQAHLLGSTTHWTRMLVMGLTFSGVLASMHWTLVEFPVPLLVTSDDPVVIWALTVLYLGDLSALLRQLAQNVLHLVGVVKLAGVEAC
jgi:hypothetical protein